jgi:hypothetical protein
MKIVPLKGAKEGKIKPSPRRRGGTEKTKVKAHCRVRTERAGYREEFDLVYADEEPTRKGTIFEALAMQRKQDRSLIRAII